MVTGPRFSTALAARYRLPAIYPFAFYAKEGGLILELVINLKTAKALGLDVPLQLQQFADEVIE